MRHFYLTWVFVLVMVSLISNGGCALSNSENRSANDKVREFELNITNPKDIQLPPELYDKFKAYWKFRYTDQFESAYAIESPDFRDAVSFEKYRLYIERTSDQQLLELQLVRLDKRDSWRAERVADVECRFYLKKETSEKHIETNLPDRWVKIDGQWNHVERNKLFLPDLGY